MTDDTTKIIYLTDNYGYFENIDGDWYYMGEEKVPDNIDFELHDIINVCDMEDNDKIWWAMDRDDETTILFRNWFKSKGIG